MLWANVIIIYDLWIERTRRRYRFQAGGISGESHGHPTGSGWPFGDHSIEREATRLPLRDDAAAVAAAADDDNDEDEEERPPKGTFCA